MCPKSVGTSKMGQTDSANVPRPRDPPSPAEVLDLMCPDRCYVVADLVAEFKTEYDPARGTVRNRLEYLTEKGRLDRIKHENRTVTYRKLD